MLMSLPSKFHLEIELPESNMSINNGTGAIRTGKLVPGRARHYFL